MENTLLKPALKFFMGLLVEFVSQIHTSPLDYVVVKILPAYPKSILQNPPLLLVKILFKGDILCTLHFVQIPSLYH